MTDEDSRVSGRLALVTGASGGIGSACCRTLASLGCNLAMSYSSTPEKCEELKAEILAHHPEVKITTHKADMRSTDETQALVPDAEKAHGAPVLILIANAGVADMKPYINDITLEDYDNTLTINLRSPFIICKAVVPGMEKEHFGRIVTIGSVSGLGTGANGCHYAASKGGISGMAKNLATRLAHHNISVNNLAPAMIQQTGMIPDAEAIPGVQDKIPLGRLGHPQEMANVVQMFVTTPYCTGQTVVAGGGYTHL